MPGSEAHASPFRRPRYDVVIAGARCAGAATALLLAREGLRVLVVDPVRRGSDTLSTHALMRGAVFQLHRWGLLEAIRAAGTPAIRQTAFHYGEDCTEVTIKSRDGVDALYAPRRTVLDRVLADAAEAAGAEVVHGYSLVDVTRDEKGRVCGARISGKDQIFRDVGAELVIGADGVRSRVARAVDADLDYAVPHAAAAIYGYWRDLPYDAFHWFYRPGASVGAIPTNDDETCVFVSLPQDRFEEERSDGLSKLFNSALEYVSGDLREAVAASDGPGKLRAFAGIPGFMRRSAGPGWALVGDAGYFKDPITAHGITDALRDAELLARAVVRGSGTPHHGYQAERDQLARGLMDVTDQISAFAWDLDEVREHHLTLSREMNAEVEHLRGLGPLLD